MPYVKAGSLTVATPGDRASECYPRRPTSATPPDIRKRLVGIAGATAVCVVLVCISVQLIDRPVSTWLHAYLGDARFAWFTAFYKGHPLEIGPFSLMAGLAQALEPLAIFALAILVVGAVAGRRLKMRDRIVLTVSLSNFAALQIVHEVKGVFGRTWPESWLGDNPSWIGNGVYGFFPFHGGNSWESFPSGHTTIITTTATLLWIVWPEFRVFWVATVAIVIAGLLGANYHFVSDIIGGLYLGAIIGLGMAGLMLLPEDRLSWSVIRGNTQRSEPGSLAIDARRTPPEQA